MIKSYMELIKRLPKDFTSTNPVEYRLVSLNCEDINCLVKLEEYILP